MGSIFRYLLRPILYLSRFKRNLECLECEVRDVNNKTDGEWEYISAVWRGNYNAESEVEKWIHNLIEKMDEAEKILGESCYRFYGASTPNIISRYRLSKKAEKVAQEIAKCLDSELAYSLFRVVDRPSSSTKMVATKDILKVLEDENVSKIGLYGITSSRMEIQVGRLEQLAISGQFFARIVRFGMSRNYDLLEIQNKLAAKIGLQLNRNVIENVSWLINDRLTNMNKTLVIFEGVHEYFNLHAIGIPRGGNCKVVLTSIEERVCNEMGTQKNMDMLELIGEPWLTFKNETEEWWQENEGEDSIAKELVQDCEALTYGPAIQMRLFQHGGITTPDVEIGAANSSFTRQMQEILKKLPSECLIYDLGRSTESEIQENESPTKKTLTELPREVEVGGILRGIKENEKIMSDLAGEVKRRCGN